VIEHRMVVADRSTDQVLLECASGCSRRVVVGPAGKLTTIDRGDFFARHSGSATPEGTTLHGSISR